MSSPIPPPLPASSAAAGDSVSTDANSGPKPPPFPGPRMSPPPLPAAAAASASTSAPVPHPFPGSANASTSVPLPPAPVPATAAAAAAGALARGPSGPSGGGPGKLSAGRLAFAANLNPMMLRGPPAPGSGPGPGAGPGAPVRGTGTSGPASGGDGDGALSPVSVSSYSVSFTASQSGDLEHHSRARVSTKRRPSTMPRFDAAPSEGFTSFAGREPSVASPSFASTNAPGRGGPVLVTGARVQAHTRTQGAALPPPPPAFAVAVPASGRSYGSTEHSPERFASYSQSTVEDDASDIAAGLAVRTPSRTPVGSEEEAHVLAAPSRGGPGRSGPRKPSDRDGSQREEKKGGFWSCLPCFWCKD